MSSQFSRRALALASVLAVGVTASGSVSAYDDKTMHGTACVAATADGATDSYYFDGVDITGDAICPLVRDEIDSAITSVFVRVDPGASAVSCAVASFAPFGYINGNDWSNWTVSSGSDAQTINVTGLGDLTQFTNGTYVAYCTSASPFHIYSIKWREP